MGEAANYPEIFAVKESPDQNGPHNNQFEETVEKGTAPERAVAEKAPKTTAGNTIGDLRIKDCCSRVFRGKDNDSMRRDFGQEGVEVHSGPTNFGREMFC